MAQINYVSTASFCVENARELGIPAALLLDKIVRLSKHTNREDGYCWYTAEQFEQETSLKKDAFARASKKLEDEGIVVRKVTYIIGTMDRATHFKLVRNDGNENTESGSERISIESGSEPLSVNTIKYNEEERKCDTALTPAPPTQFLIGAERSEKVSVRPNKKEADPARRPYAVGQAVLKAWGFKTAKIGVPMANLIRGWLDAGFADKDIIEAGQMMKQSGDNYWAQATPIQMLTQNAMLWYQQHKQKKTLDDIPHIKVGDRYYEIEPQTGKPIREIKL